MRTDSVRTSASAAARTVVSPVPPSELGYCILGGHHLHNLGGICDFFFFEASERASCSVLRALA